jgi:hypothetical protein
MLQVAAIAPTLLRLFNETANRSGSAGSAEDFAAFLLRAQQQAASGVPSATASAASTSASNTAALAQLEVCRGGGRDREGGGLGMQVAAEQSRKGLGRCRDWIRRIRLHDRRHWTIA